ncbi:MAG: hypothetical protein HKN26_08035 [Acidimicrobiales bacterium]|nr:hypothetical protein [Acidimicrobiales bacterium]
MRRTLPVLLATVIIAAGCLRAPAEEADLNFGYALDPFALASIPQYQAIVANDATMVTVENYMKWGLIHPNPSTYDFTLADQIVATAQANGQQVRGHVLVWHTQLPGWLTNGTWTRDSLLAVMEDHITTVVTHFRDNFPGVVTHWDVVNEAFNPDGSRRDTIFQQVIGDDYIEKAFAFARAADPDISLFYNDFYDDFSLAGETLLTGVPAGPGATPTQSDCAQLPKCAATQAMLTDFVARGVPIDGLGFQAHVLLGQAPDYVELADWVGPLGLEWAATELDVKVLSSLGDNSATRSAHADTFVSVLDDCLESDRCDTVILWGVGDAHSWLPGFTNGLFDYGLIYDDDYLPKLAVVKMFERLEAASVD